MAASLGEAMAEGRPVVFTSENRPPQLLYVKGKEAEALKLLDDMHIIELLIMDVKEPKHG